MTGLSRRTFLGRATVISASGENEDALELAALEHGLFTHCLIRALDGGADSDRDGVLTGGVAPIVVDPRAGR